MSDGSGFVTKSQIYLILKAKKQKQIKKLGGPQSAAPEI